MSSKENVWKVKLRNYLNQLRMLRRSTNVKPLNVKSAKKRIKGSLGSWWKLSLNKGLRGRS
jgi:hypothetical protein